MPEITAAPPSAAPQPSPGQIAPPTSQKSPPSPPVAGEKFDTIPQPEESNDPFKDAFAEIDEVAGNESAKEDRRNRGDKADAAEKPPEEKSKVNGDIKPGDKPKEKEPKTNPELRAAYDSLKQKVATELEPQLKELSTLRAKLNELESRDESGAKAIQEEIASVKKRNAELEQHIRFVDFEKSKEYQEQYQKPYEDAWGAALRDLKGLTMTVEDPKTGEEVRREVTQADIAYFANLDPANRRIEINRLFPEDKEEVKRHINQISTLAEKAHSARERAKSEAETHSKTQTEAQRHAQVQRAKLWKQTNDALAAKYPKQFGKDETDPDGNMLYDKGSAFADLIFSPADLTPERVELLPQAFKEAIQSSKPFTPEMMVKMHAIAAKKIANHDRALTRLKAAAAKIAELEKSLKEYEESSPDTIRIGSGRRDKDAPLTAEEEFDMIARG